MFKFKRQIWSYGAAIASVIIAAGLMLVLNPYIELTKASDKITLSKIGDIESNCPSTSTRWF